MRSMKCVFVMLTLFGTAVLEAGQVYGTIDNTRLSGSERCSVSLTALNPNVVSLTLAYFPASRASLKDKPYYGEVINPVERPSRPSSRTSPCEAA